MGHFDADIPAYASVARMLRDRILAGEYAIGDRLPSAAELEATEEVSRETARRALRVLVGEGLARGHSSRGTRVLPPPRKRIVDMSAPDPEVERRQAELGADRVVRKVSARRARPEEQVTLGIGEQVWVFVVSVEFWVGEERLDTLERVLPADSTVLELP